MVYYEIENASYCMIDITQQKSFFSLKDCNNKKMPLLKKCTLNKYKKFLKNFFYSMLVYLIWGESNAFIYFRSKSAQLVFQKTLNLTWKARERKKGKNYAGISTITK